jgi:hypothetical protein
VGNYFKKCSETLKPTDAAARGRFAAAVLAEIATQNADRAP